jgi:hypothetical protein
MSYLHSSVEDYARRDFVMAVAFKKLVYEILPGDKNY